MLIYLPCLSTETTEKVDLSALPISPRFIVNKWIKVPTGAIGHHDGTQVCAMAPVPIKGQHLQGYLPSAPSYH